MSFFTEGFALESIENNCNSEFFAAVVTENRPPMDDIEQQGLFEMKLSERIPRGVAGHLRG